MKEIAWVGSQRDFEREFHSRKGIFVDNEILCTRMKIRGEENEQRERN